jgi:hypothetical protein
MTLMPLVTAVQWSSIKQHHPARAAAAAALPLRWLRWHGHPGLQLQALLVQWARRHVLQQLLAAPLATAWQRRRAALRMAAQRLAALCGMAWRCWGPQQRTAPVQQAARFCMQPAQQEVPLCTA